MNWLRELQKFSQRGLSSAALLTGAQATTLPAVDILTCSYDLACRPTINSSLRQWLTARPKNNVLVLDEVHFLKSVSAVRSHAVLARDGLIHHAARTWALSGTPAPNHVAELYPILRCFGVWRDSYDAFVRRFCTTRPSPHPPGYAICGHQNIPEFRALIAPHMLRRKKSEVMTELPPILFSDVTVPATEFSLGVVYPEYTVTRRVPELLEKLKHDRELVDAMVAPGMKDVSPLAALATSVSTLRKWTGMLKIKGVADLVADELNGGLDKVVLFAIHKAVIEGLREALVAFNPVILYGGTPAAKRDRNIDKFQKDPKCRVFIGQVLAAGVGINLTSACNVMVVEPDWVPGNNAQAVMRVHRIGQTRPVLVRYVLLEGDELDKRVQRVLRRKTQDLVAVFD